MPIVKVNKSVAWSLWQKGRINGINAGHDEPLQLLLNLAINKGLNALRVFISYSGTGYRLVPLDYMSIGQSFANDPTSSTSGWNMTSKTATAQYYSDANGKTIAEVGDRITALLDACATVGVGVILTVECWATSTDRMWVAKAADPEPADRAFDESLLVGSSIATRATGAPDTTGETLDTHWGLMQFWQATANKWGAHPALIGYDILNEPQPPAPAAWVSAATLIVDGIRAVDTVTPIIIESPDFASPDELSAFETGSPSLVSRSSADKLVFSIHAYRPAGHTHAGIAEWAYEQMGATYPINGAVIDFGAGVLRSVRTATELVNAYYSKAVQFKQTHKVPLYVGEFSYVDQTGEDFLTDAGAFYQPPESSYSRQVTAIEVDGTAGTVTLVMGNIQRIDFADRSGLGFCIDTSDETLAQLATNGITTVGAADSYVSNTVLLTLQKVSNRDATISDATYDGFDAIVDALNIVNQPVTIKRGGYRYVFTMNTTAASIARQAAITGTGGALVRYPAVATISLAPTTARVSGQDASRVAFAKHILTMCQDNGFAWSWHSVSSETGRHWWRASSAIYTQLRNAAMGRKMLP